MKTSLTQGFLLQAVDPDCFHSAPKPVRTGLECLCDLRRVFPSFIARWLAAATMWTMMWTMMREEWHPLLDGRQQVHDPFCHVSFPCRLSWKSVSRLNSSLRVLFRTWMSTGSVDRLLSPELFGSSHMQLSTMVAGSLTSICQPSR